MPDDIEVVSEQGAVNHYAVDDFLGFPIGDVNFSGVAFTSVIDSAVYLEGGFGALRMSMYPNNTVHVRPITRQGDGG